MTAGELQRIALHLSNQGWCRHWLNYGDRHENVQMAIQVLDSEKAVPIPELNKLGFKQYPENLYTIERTNDDGTPFVSKLF